MCDLKGPHPQLGYLFHSDIYFTQMEEITTEQHLTVSRPTETHTDKNE